MIDEVFIPFSFDRWEGPATPLSWHTAGAIPSWEKARLVIFEMGRPAAPDAEVAKALASLSWETAPEEIVHLGRLAADSTHPAYSKWLADIWQFLRTSNPQAVWLTYTARATDQLSLFPLDQPGGWMALFKPRLEARDEKPIRALLEDGRLDHLFIGGIQAFYTDRALRNLMSFPQVDIWRLAELKDQPDLMDVMLRQVQRVAVDYSLLAFGVTANDRHGIAGMDIYDWVKMFYHAGLSPVIRHVDVYAYVPGDFPGRDAEALALGIWHLWEGMKNKERDFPLIEKEKLEHFRIAADHRHWAVYLNPQTGRWWIDLWEEPRRMLPVTAKTVEMLREEKVPLHLLKYFL